MPGNIKDLREVLYVMILSMVVTIDRCTRYYVNQSGGCEIGPIYMATFRMKRVIGIAFIFRGLFRFVIPLLYSGAKAVGKEALKTGSNIITDIPNKEPEEPVGAIFKNRFSEAKDNLQVKIKKMTRSGLHLKRKRNSKEFQSRSKRRKVKDIVIEN